MLSRVPCRAKSFLGTSPGRSQLKGEVDGDPVKARDTCRPARRVSSAVR